MRIWIMIEREVAMAVNAIVISNLVLNSTHFRQQIERLLVLMRDQANLTDKIESAQHG